MQIDKRRNRDSVTVSVEINGEYDDVVSKLRDSGDEKGYLGVVSEDLTVVLDTIAEIDGGTRSAIVEALPEHVREVYDAEGIVDALRVLERYDLVALDENTWVPGRELSR